MTKKQVELKHYRFTGSYSHYKEDQKEEALKIRKQGFKAVVVDIPTSKYSWDTKIMGYSVYAEKKYFDYQNKISAEKELQNIPKQKEQLKKEYEEKLNKIIEREEYLKSLIEKYSD
jgi:16S rRNA C1402 N4-methylase RsmH